MLASISSLLVPLALTAGLGSTSPVHHDVTAYVTGYNTIPGQTDSTPCIAASGADICGRQDAVACPRRISLGTTVEIHGATYICEDRLATKFDTRFDISCDKDTDCPPTVTGWTTIRVYDDASAETAPPVTKLADKAPVPHPLHATLNPGHPTRIARLLRGSRAPALAKPMLVAAKAPAGPVAPSPVAQRLIKAFKVASVLRGGRG